MSRYDHQCKSSALDYPQLLHPCFLCRCTHSVACNLKRLVEPVDSHRSLQIRPPSAFVPDSGQFLHAAMSTVETATPGHGIEDNQDILPTQLKHWLACRETDLSSFAKRPQQEGEAILLKVGYPHAVDSEGLPSGHYGRTCKQGVVQNSKQLCTDLQLTCRLTSCKWLVSSLLWLAPVCLILVCVVLVAEHCAYCAGCIAPCMCASTAYALTAS